MATSTLSSSRLGRRTFPGAAVAMLAPILLLFLGAYVVPLGKLVGESFFRAGQFTLANHTELLTSAAFGSIVLRTLTMSLTVTVLCLLIGYPLAYCLSRMSGRAAAALLLLVTVPYITSILIRSYAWVVVLGANGVVNNILMSLGLIEDPLKLVFNQLGAYVGMVQVQLPLMVFPLYAAMRRIDRSLLAAAKNLGSSPASAFAHVFVPLSVPGIISGTTLVFLSCLGFYVTPALLGGPGEYMIAQGIQVRVTTLADFGAAAAQATLLLIAVVAIFVVFRSRFASDFAGQTEAAQRAARSDDGLRTWAPVLEHLAIRATPALRVLGNALSAVRTPLLWTVAVLALGYLIVPMLVVIPLAFSKASYLTFPPPGYSLRWFTSFFNNQQWLAATWFSLWASAAAACLSLVLGMPAAFALMRKRLPGKLVIYLLLISPLVVPHIVIGVALFFSLVPVGLSGTPLGFILGYAIIAVPYVVVLFTGGLQRFDRSLELAAAGLGARPATVIRTVTIPLLMPTLVSAFLFAFIVGFDDVVLGLFLSSPSATPLPIRMWDDIRQEISPQIAVVAVLLFAGLLAFYAIYATIQRMSSRKYSTVEPTAK